MPPQKIMLDTQLTNNSKYDLEFMGIKIPR